MSRKKNRARRHRRRERVKSERAQREAERVARTAASEPIDHAKVALRYRNMQGRGFRWGLIPFGPLVRARDPEELERNVAGAMEEAMRNEPIN